MPKISKAEARRLMDEILREQMERPALRPSDSDAAAANPFRTETDVIVPRPTPAADDRDNARV